MCGIVGFLSKKHFAEACGSLSKATNTLSHRGPDDAGMFFDDNAGVGLGHRRLSIIDLTRAGRQPMASDDGKVQIVHNGEVYNFREIRQSLLSHGHVFNSQTDTEVILKAYMQWGIQCLDRFVGMFAFAIWDSNEQKLLLARDRLGIKPLYYHHSERGFSFASELKALMAFSDFRKDLDPDALVLFLHYQYVPGPRSIFRNTWKLLPGHYAVFDQEGLKTRRYWEVPAHEPDIHENWTESHVVERLEDLLTLSVSDHLVGDVPLGALLSGGIDSSLVVALMQRINPSPVRTFTIGFKEEPYNEAVWAKRVANHLGTDHCEILVTPKDALAVVPRLPEMYDEPFADSSAIPTSLVCQLARSEVAVALSGDGGDEQFAGYVRYWAATGMLKGFRRIPRSTRKILARAFDSLSFSSIEAFYGLCGKHLPQRFRVNNLLDKWQKLLRILNDAALSEIYRMTVCLWGREELYNLMGKDLPESRYESLFDESDVWSPVAMLMRVDRETYLPDAMLSKVDRAGMAVGLEVRVPLLDHRVVEYTSLMPDSLKIRNGTGKYILKRLLAKYLPVSLFKRPKMGFALPLDEWFRGELKPLLSDYLSPSRLKREGLFDEKVIEKKILEHLQKKANHQYRLWSLLMWEMWKEKWLSG
ncbi:MAG: asparagine synthase (glutamine-hydrolyzing) [Deltaproteobacteria bacterium]|nr:asparagine synthase (glutamine-hydrolyzing) [Deltaproteobacteria bacterium]